MTAAQQGLLRALLVAATLGAAGRVHGASQHAEATRPGTVGAGTPSPRDTRLELALNEWRAARSPATLEHALNELVALGAPRARLGSIGEGRAGRQMFALELGAVGAPGVVVVPGTVAQEPPREDTPETARDLYCALDALLALARELVAGEAQGAAQLDTRRVVLLFGARPDLLAPRLASPGFDVTRNFPVDWDLAQQAGGGPYPLALPETRALASWLDSEPALYAAALVGAAPLTPEWLALGVDAADLEQARLLAGPRVRAALGDVTPPVSRLHGGFARHARLRAGLAVVALPAPSSGGPAEAPSTAGGGAALHLGAIAELLDAAPRLELALDPSPRLVGPDLWQVEAVLANVGGLGTANVAHTRERRPRGVTLSVSGGDLCVGAVRVGDGPFRVLDTQLDPAGRVVLRAGDLDAGARLCVRLFIRRAKDSGAERGRERPFEVRAEAPRALSARSFVTPPNER